MTHSAIIHMPELSRMCCNMLVGKDCAIIHMHNPHCTCLHWMCWWKWHCTVILMHLPQVDKLLLKLIWKMAVLPSSCPPQLGASASLGCWCFMTLSSLHCAYLRMDAVLFSMFLQFAVIIPTTGGCCYSMLAQSDTVHHHANAYSRRMCCHSACRCLLTLHMNHLLSRLP